MTSQVWLVNRRRLERSKRNSPKVKFYRFYSHFLFAPSWTIEPVHRRKPLAFQTEFAMGPSAWNGRSYRIREQIKMQIWKRYRTTRDVHRLSQLVWNHFPSNLVKWSIWNIPNKLYKNIFISLEYSNKILQLLLLCGCSNNNFIIISIIIDFSGCLVNT